MAPGPFHPRSCTSAAAAEAQARGLAQSKCPHFSRGKGHDVDDDGEMSCEVIVAATSAIATVAVAAAVAAGQRETRTEERIEKSKFVQSIVLC